MRPHPRLLLLGLLLGACTGDGDVPSPRGGSAKDSGGSDTDLDVEVEGCHAEPREADTHEVWAAFPYTASAGQSDLWRSYGYDGDALTETDSIELGRAWTGRGAWTPDGAFAYLVDEDGRVHTPAGIWQELYVSSLTLDRSGEIAWLVNPNWADSGGGIYRATVDCDTGALGSPELVWTGKNASFVVLRPGTASEAAVITRELDGVAGIVHFVDLWTGEALAHHDAFGDDEAIVSDAAWDHEGERLLVADFSEFSSQPTRVAIVSDSGPVDIIEVEDPVSVLTAPWPEGDGLVLSGYGNAAFVLERTEDSYTLGGQVASLSLPGIAADIRRGGQRGHVLVPETTGLHLLRFEEGGGLSDGGPLLYGTEYTDSVGAIAVQP